MIVRSPRTDASFLNSANRHHYCNSKAAKHDVRILASVLHNMTFVRERQRADSIEYPMYTDCDLTSGGEGAVRADRQRNDIPTGT